MVLCAFVASAQTKTVALAIDKTFIDVPSLASDSVGAVQTTFTYFITAPKAQATTQDWGIRIHELAACNVSIAVTGAKFTGTGYVYTSIATGRYYGGGTDTTLVISNATASRYQYYKVVFTRNAGKAQITDFQFKQYLE